MSCLEKIVVWCVFVSLIGFIVGGSFIHPDFTADQMIEGVVISDEDKETIQYNEVHGIDSSALLDGILMDAGVTDTGVSFYLDTFKWKIFKSTE